VFAVSRHWAAGGRELLSKFLGVWHDALRWAHDQKNRDEVIAVLAEAEKIDASAAANRLRQLPASGELNLPGLQTVLDLRVQIGLTPPMGNELESYYDSSYCRRAVHK
jgi:ABC-type nitrate/sulfonate/bicarbonate transport system substrate-binding protein